MFPRAILGVSGLKLSRSGQKVAKKVVNLTKINHFLSHFLARPHAPTGLNLSRSGRKGSHFPVKKVVN